MIRTVGTIGNDAERERAWAHVEASMERDRAKDKAPPKHKASDVLWCGHSTLSVIVDEQGAEVCTQCTGAEVVEQAVVITRVFGI